MKVLCMCQGGNSRSVALGFLMKYRYGEDALACSWEKNTPETLKMLFEWADRIFVMQNIFKQYVPEQYHAKLYVVDVGEDVWFNGLHPELLNLLMEMLEPKQKEKNDGTVASEAGRDTRSAVNFRFEDYSSEEGGKVFDTFRS